MRPLVGTSLKMHLTPTATDRYLQDLLPLVAGLDACDLFVLPSFPALWVARDRLAGTGVAWGAQDVHPAEGGAHTGDVSAAMLVDLGCRFAEVGHAERRRDHGETDELVAAKAAGAIRHGLVPIVCVGESEEGPAAGALRVVERQLSAVLQRAEVHGGGELVVAYEPVWAIGAGGRAAASSYVGAVHRGIRELLGSALPAGVPARVIYGGSVDPASAADLAAEPGVDGLFVGRAALDPSAFAAIARVVAAVAAGTIA